MFLTLLADTASQVAHHCNKGKEGNVLQAGILTMYWSSERQEIQDCQTLYQSLLSKPFALTSK